MSKLITKGRLIVAMERGRAEGFNHQVNEGVINSLDPAHHYPVMAVVDHFHKQGENCEPHLRLLVEVKTRNSGNEMLLIDVPEDLYLDLPEDYNSSAG